MTAFFIAIIAYVVISDIIPLILNKELKTVFVNGILSIVSIVVFILYKAGIKLPSPSDFIEKIIRFVFGDLVSMLGR